MKIVKSIACLVLSIQICSVDVSAQGVPGNESKSKQVEATESPAEMYDAFLSAIRNGDAEAIREMSAPYMTPAIEKLMKEVSSKNGAKKFADFGSTTEASAGKEFGQIAVIVRFDWQDDAEDGLDSDPLFLEKIDGKWKLIMVGAKNIHQRLDAKKKLSFERAYQWYNDNESAIRKEALAAKGKRVDDKTIAGDPPVVIVVPKRAFSIVGTEALLLGKTEVRFRSNSVKKDVSDGFEVLLKSNKEALVTVLGEKAIKHEGTWTESRGILSFECSDSNFEFPAVSAYFVGTDRVLIPAKNAPGFSRQTKYRDANEKAKSRKWILKSVKD